jgi:hypothetical protein
MTGILYYKDERYLISNNHGHGKMWWAWKIETDIKNKPYTFKWKKIPRSGYLEVFDFENIPPTVSFLPLLSEPL